MGIYIILIFLALILFYLQYEMIGVLKKDKMKISYFDGGYTNTVNLYSIIKKEKNLTKKTNYSILIGLFVIFMLLFILTLVAVILK